MQLEDGKKTWSRSTYEDFDGDGICDAVDQDADGDGIPNGGVNYLFSAGTGYVVGVYSGFSKQRVDFCGDK